MGGLVAVLVLLLAGLSLLGVGRLSIRMPVEQRAEFDCAECATYPPRLVADGHDLVRDDGSTVTLRGVMVPALDRLSDQGRLAPELFGSIASTGANVVRLPVDPDAWRSDHEFIARHLDPAVRMAGEAGLYAIIDLHLIGNVVSGTGQAMPEAPAVPFAHDVWQAVSTYFRAAPHAIFEIVNEPAGIAADAWQPVAQSLVQTIRDGGARQVVIVGGVDFASDASWVADAPIADDNVAYAVHIYPGTRVDWEGSFGRISVRYPVLVTEWGFMDENPSRTQAYLNGSRVTYGDRLLAFLEERGIGWVACWWDAEWEPPMLARDGTGYTGLGQYVVERLGGER